MLEGLRSIVEKVKKRKIFEDVRRKGSSPSSSYWEREGLRKKVTG